MVNERGWLRTIFILYFLLALGYSLLMPIWEAPDEPAHYHISWYLARRDKYPSQKVNYEAHQPRAFYYLASWIIRSLDRIDPHYSDYYLPREIKQNIRVPERRFEWTDQNYRFILGVYVLRWLNIVLGAVALWLTWKALRLIVPDQPSLRLAALALAALMPQFLHIMSSVSNDALGALAGALLFYLAIRIANEPSIRILLLSVILAFLLPLVTKLTVLPVSAALLIIVALNWCFKLHRKRRLLFSGLVIIFGAVLFYLLFPETIRSAANEIYWRLFSLRKNALTSDYLKFILSQIIWTYWGKVGWLAVGLPAWTVNSLTALGLLGMCFNAYFLIKGKLESHQRKIWFAVWLIVLFTITAVLRDGLTTKAAQGRLLFPAIGALSLLMVSGWRNVLPEIIQRFPPLILTVLMVALNMGLWIFGVIPIYYQPFLD